MSTEQVTLYVALAGIFGTISAPLLAEWMRRRSTRSERLLTERLSLYGELLEVASLITENARTLASIPHADLPEPDVDRVRRIDARVRALGGKDVRERTRDFAKEAARFAADRFQVGSAHLRRDSAGDGDSQETIAGRIHLARVADELAARLDRLEQAVRRELNR